MSEEITISSSTGLTFIEERGKCIVVRQGNNRRNIYVPRSLVSYMRKEQASMAGTPLTIRIPLWLAEEKNLSDK